MSAKAIRGGYANGHLVVDLTSGRIEKEPLDPDIARQFIGGRGLDAKIVYDLIRPGIDPLSPGNVLTFGIGPLVGTLAPAASRVTAMAKSPLTGFIGISNAGVNGATLKRAGFDQLTILGKAPRPVYLFITDEAVEVRDARHLWGKDTRETTAMLREHAPSDCWVTAIGPAGENKVRFAAMLGDNHGAFGRTGLGAVMGSKNLKAILVYGKKPINVAEPARFTGLAKKALKAIMSFEDQFASHRKGGTFLSCFERAKKWAQPPKDMDIEAVHPEVLFQRYDKVGIACEGCPVGCKTRWELKDGKYPGFAFDVSCSAGTFIQTWGQGMSIKRLDDTGLVTEMVQRFGLDSMTMEHVLELLFDLYDKEIIGPKETGGLRLETGDPETILELMRRTVYREGIGDILADGPIEVCRRLGVDPNEHLIHYKGSRVPGQVIPDIRSELTTLTFGVVVNPRGLHCDPYRFPTPPDVETPEMWAKAARHIGVPEDKIREMFTEIAGRGERCNIPLLSKYVENYNVAAWSMGLCDRRYVLWAYDADTLADFYSSATGIPLTTEELLTAGERTWNIQKAFNLREGASRKDDYPPKRVFREPLVGYEKTFPAFKEEQWEALLNAYYRVHGWDVDTGKPTRDTLMRVGLKQVADDIGAK